MARAKWRAISAGLLLLTGCDSPGTTEGASGTDADTTSDTGGRPDVGVDGSGEDELAVCDRWRADRQSRAEGTWSGGDTDSCEPGTLSMTGQENTLVQVNLYRWLAGLPPVELDAARSEDAQACALTMHANRDIQHVIPDGWRCQSEASASAARLSNLATLPAVGAVDLYMDDEGIESLGHRRWILSNSLGPIGVGSTNQYSCLHVLGGRGRADARFTAWPPPGLVPLQALFPAGWADIDKAGWSIQSDTVPVHLATEVTVKKDGVEVEVDTWVLDEGYGSAFGLGIRPRGFATEPGSTYEVTLEGSAFDAVTYSFTPIDCR